MAHEPRRESRFAPVAIRVANLVPALVFGLVVGGVVGVSGNPLWLAVGITIAVALLGYPPVASVRHNTVIARLFGALTLFAIIPMATGLIVVVSIVGPDPVAIYELTDVGQITLLDPNSPETLSLLFGMVLFIIGLLLTLVSGACWTAFSLRARYVDEPIRRTRF